MGFGGFEMFWTGSGLVLLSVLLDRPLKGNGGVILWLLLPICNLTYALRHPGELAGGMFASFAGASCAVLPWFWWRYRKDPPEERRRNMIVIGIFVIGGLFLMSGAGVVIANMLQLGRRLLGR